MRRQADVMNYQLGYLFRHSGIAPLPPYPGPPLDAVPRDRQPLPNPIRPMASLVSSAVPASTGMTSVTPGLPEIPSTFGTPVIAVQTETTTVTTLQAEESSQL